jgi:hypothetical protein
MLFRGSTFGIRAAFVIAAGIVLADPSSAFARGVGFAVDNGDVNGDLERDLSDGIYLLGSLFLGGQDPVPLATCAGAEATIRNGDSNGDGELDLSDAMHLFGWLYSGGREPASACPSEGSGGGGGGTPRVVPVEARPFGKSYAEWSALWWQTIYSIPFDDNPLATGDCHAGSGGPNGQVAFIAAPLGPDISSVCSVQEGQAILFPLSSFANDYPCPDPSFEPAPGQSLEDFLREGAEALIDLVESVSLRIDGKEVRNLSRNRVGSDLFLIDGDPSLTATFDPCVTGEPQPAVSDGYWVMITPLPPGEHSLLVNVVFAGMEFQVDNRVTVVPRS